MPANSRELRAESREGSANWIPAPVVAELRGVTSRTILRLCVAGELEHRYDAGPTGGRALMIAVSALTPAEQFRAQQRAATARGTATGEEPQSGTPLDDARGSEYERASPSARREADRRLRLLQGWWQYQDLHPNQRTVAREAYCTALRSRPGGTQGERVSPSTLYNWEGAYRARGLDGLLPAWGRAGRKATVAKDSQDGQLLLALWSGQQQRGVAPCYRSLLIVRQDREIPGPAPTMGAIRYLLSTLSQEEKDALRLGDKAYASRHVSYIERDRESILPLEWFVLDHRQVDILTFNRATRRRFRPYITALMDIRTCRVCVVVSERPNQDVVLRCIGKAIAAWGSPAHIYMDNGKEFTAKSIAGKPMAPFTLGVNEARMAGLCEQIGATPHFAKKFNAQAKPVERFLGTMAKDFDTLFHFYTGRSPDAKPEDLKDKLSLGEVTEDLGLERVLTGWIESDYHTREHKGQGMQGKSPNQVWAELIGQVAVRTPTREQLKWFLLRGGTCEVKRNQVRIFGRSYVPALENVDCLYGWSGKTLAWRHDPEDIRHIWLTDAEDYPVGWVIEKSLLRHGEVTGEMFREGTRRQARGKATQRNAREYLIAERAEPDALKRLVIEHYAKAAEIGADGRPQPSPPPGTPGVRKILPMRAGARASMRIVAAGPPTRDAREAAAAAAANDDAALALILERENAPAPAPADNSYGEALALILEARA